MNAGMYHSDYSPVGLFVSQSNQLSALNTQSGQGNFFMKPNGVFVVTKNGAQVIESTHYSKLSKATLLATQSGPLLLNNGKIHPAFNPGSNSKLIRNGVCSPTPDKALFVISNGKVNLYEFAIFFRDSLGCEEALYFDGVVSSLYSSKLNRNDFRANLGPIIAITE
jgi:uncharacterized protein YigE (DUF2233 family)